MGRRKRPRGRSSGARGARRAAARAMMAPNLGASRNREAARAARPRRVRRAARARRCSASGSATSSAPIARASPRSGATCRCTTGRPRKPPRTREHGTAPLTLAELAPAAGARADVIFLCLPNTDDTRAVLPAPSRASLAPGQIALDATSARAADARALAADCSPRAACTTSTAPSRAAGGRARGHARRARRRRRRARGRARDAGRRVLRRQGDAPRARRLGHLVSRR